MTHNQMITCNMCETKINLRAQVGGYNIPFNTACPKCKISIEGKLFVDDLNKLEVRGARKIAFNNKDNKDNKVWCVELSAEFPTKKMYLRDTQFLKENINIKNYNNSEELLTPFMRTTSFFNTIEDMENIQKAMKFSEYIKTDYEYLKSYFELFWVNSFDLLYPKLERELKNYEQIRLSKVNNEMDASMALHQLFICTTGISSIIYSNDLEEYSRISQLILEKDNLPFVFDFINKVDLNLNEMEKKAFQLIDLFATIYEQIIPVVVLENSNSYQKLNKEENGIMTANFDELTSFYAKSYEYILDNLDIIIYFNNIVARNDYNLFFENKTHEKFISLKSKYKKLDYINQSEPFSKPMKSLKNTIRNSIQHFDCEIDYVSQSIYFKDEYGGNINIEELYLIDFASLCRENFSLIVYYLEIIYILRKLQLTNNGIVQSNIPKDFLNPKIKKKVGRNSPCPCGSGKKYKRCCL